MILNSGKLDQVGTADEVYDAPASAFVMSFVGDTSSIPVEFNGDRLLHEGLPFEAKFEGACQGHGRLYVRPKDIELVNPSAGQLLGTVINVHRTATGRRAQIKLSDTTIVEAEVGLNQNLRVGDRIGLKLLKARAFSD